MIGLRWHVVLGLFVVGCGPLVSNDEDGGDEGGTSADSSSSNTRGDEAGSSNATTGPSSSSNPPMTTPATFSTSGDVTDPFDPTTSDSGGGQPNGAQCMQNIECASGMCFLAGILGGICGDCLGDADCDFGCTGPNPLADPPMGSYCNEGLYGDGCQTSDACQPGYVCNAIIDVPGVLTRSTCSECLSDADCGPGLCAPDIDLAGLAGAWECVPPSSRALGEFCDLEGSGHAQCSSGFCAIADLMGLLQVGVCSECLDADACIFGMRCLPPTVDLDGTVVAGHCN